jgi:hypothetical protein
MKKRSLFFSALVLLVVASCKPEREVDPEDDAREYRFVRLLVSDEAGKQVSLVNPQDGSVQSFDARFPKASVYTTESGRFAVLIHRDNNFVEKFDTGFEGHGDHVDIRGTPKWAAMTGEGKLPTHFASHGNEVAIFNDGDGTFDVGVESDFHKPGAKMQNVKPANVAHHGAMMRFDNGTYAVTHKDGSIAGTLPERVKIVDKSGTVLHQSTVQTKGIHGDATDGKIALFGSASGVLVVEQSGAQRLIPHPASFGTAWFGTIYYAPAAQKFIGYTAAMGAYVIDPVSGSITPIFENKDLMQAKPDYAGETFVTLTHGGEARIFDLKTNTLKTQGSVLSATDKDEKQKPTLVATKKYLYLTQPKTGEVLQVPTSNLTGSTRIKVSGTPYRISVAGLELNRKGDD